MNNMSIPKNKKEKPISKKESEAVDKMLNGLDQKKLPTRKKIKKALTDEQKMQNLEVLRSILSEHMDCYMIFGFGLTEEPVGFLQANSPMQHKAMLGMLEDVADQFLNPGFPPGMDILGD